MISNLQARMGVVTGERSTVVTPSADLHQCHVPGTYTLQDVWLDLWPFLSFSLASEAHCLVGEYPGYRGCGQPTAAHSSGFMEEHGYLYAFKLALKFVAQTPLQCL